MEGIKICYFCFSVINVRISESCHISMRSRAVNYQKTVLLTTYLAELNQAKRLASAALWRIKQNSTGGDVTDVLAALRPFVTSQSYSPVPPLVLHLLCEIAHIPCLQLLAATDLRQKQGVTVHFVTSQQGYYCARPGRRRRKSQS